jgi:hypothetical protein
MPSPPPFIIPHNEWPDPQFCIQDANSVVTTMNDQLTGTVNQISVIGYTTGLRNVTAYTGFTDQLAVGDLIYFNAPADLALRQSAFRVTAVVPNVSFSFTIEYKDGIPSVSNACLVNPMQRGDYTGAAGGLITSNVRRFANGSVWPHVWISERAPHTQLLRGCKRVIVFRKVTSGDEYLYWEAGGARLVTIRGTSRAVGAAVHVANGSGATARAYVVDNTGPTLSSAVASTASRTWLSAQKTASVTTGVWQEGVVFSGPAGSTFVVGEFTAAPSAGELFDGSFSTILLQASLSPWVAARLTTPASQGPGGTFEFVVDMKQASRGEINEGVSYLTGLLEGQSNAAGNLLPSRHRLMAPTLYNPVLRAPVSVANPFGSGNPANYAFASGNFLLDGEAKMVFYSGTASNQWGFLSWDIHGAVLFADP